MTRNLESRKYRLIQEIMKIEEESLLKKIEHDLEQGLEQLSSIWDKVIVPTKKTISLKQMIKDQNYLPISNKEFFELAEDLKIEDPLEDLLAQLN